MAKSLHSHEYKRLTRHLVESRREAGLSQRALAQRLKVAPSWVAKVELGERRLDLAEYLGICKALQLDAEKMAGEVAKIISG